MIEKTKLIKDIIKTPHMKKIMKKMFKIVDVDYNTMRNVHDWYLQHSWSADEQEKFKKCSWIVHRIW